MPVAPFQIIAGPADVYIAATATAFPAVNAVPGAGWTYLGQTEGGVTVRHTQDIEQLTTDQNTGPVKAIRTGEGLEIEFALAEITLENFRYVMNSGTVTSAVGPPATKTINLYKHVEVAIHSLLVKGPSPYGNFNMQYQVPVVYHDGEPEMAFVKDDKVTLACTFTALADLTAGSVAERFGKLVAQTA